MRRRSEREFDVTRDWLGTPRHAVNYDRAQPAYGLHDWLRSNEERTMPLEMPLNFRRYAPMVECVVWDDPGRRVTLEGDTVTEEFILI